MSTLCLIDRIFANIEERYTKNQTFTGKKRNTLDQFYTCEKVSNQCIQLFLQTIDVNKTDIIIEPSAGFGAFSDYFHKHNFQLDAFDIDPKQEYIKEQDFLTMDIHKYKEKKVHCIGNPPFGIQSSLAKQFIKKLATFCDTIALILPKSFRKQSFMKTFPLNYHLIKEIDIEKNAFTINGEKHHVNCIFQIWIKKEVNRHIEPIQKECGFEFIKKPKVKDSIQTHHGKPLYRENIFTEEPDFAILRAGGGNTCGRISLNYKDGIECYPEAWLFIKLDDKYDKDRFYQEYNKINWIDDSNVGARSIDKQTFIKSINHILSII